MAKTDMSEKGLEDLIVAALTGQATTFGSQPDGILEKPTVPYGQFVYTQGDSAHYDKDHAVDLDKLLRFLRATQPKVVEQLALDVMGLGVAHSLLAYRADNSQG